jgi:hypothetical protein
MEDDSRWIFGVQASRTSAYFYFRPPSPQRLPPSLKLWWTRRRDKKKRFRLFLFRG